MELLNLIFERTFARLALLCETQEVTLKRKQKELLGEASTERVKLAGEQLEDVIRFRMRNGEIVRYYKLITRWNMEPTAVCALEMCLTQLQYPELTGILQILGYPGVTLELVTLARAAGNGNYAGESFQDLERIYLQISSILGHKLEQIPFYRYPLKADERLMGYLLGSDTLDKRLNNCAVRHFFDQDVQELLTGHEKAQEIAEALMPRWNGIQTILQISGANGSGRKTLLKYACHEAQLNLLLLDYSLLYENAPSVRREMMWIACRELIFYDMGICFYGLEESGGCQTKQERREFLYCCVEPLLGKDTVICINTEPQTELISMIHQYVGKIYLPALTREQRIEVWEGCAKRYGIQMDCVSAGVKFKLTTEEICKAAVRLAISGENKPNSAKVTEVCSEVLEPASQGNIKLVKSGYTLDDLKLPKEQKKQLHNICAHVWQRHKVFDEWNMESRFAYGKNVSALFVGPPGTGKTMAVHVLSDMLELPLYRIDISQIVDKYIGETEKRLEEVFNVAEKNNAILFFDEADSIFGKRSEVNDAKDKYANTEVSYILQRMEEYDGIVILATNYKKNIDEAFMRRIRYLVEFTLPGEAIRREIWESSFAPEVPLEDVNFDYLARQFELAGGNIKNIVLNAVFKAASEGQSVGMLHILESIRTENMKMGKKMIRQDFAEYGDLLDY